MHSEQNWPNEKACLEWERGRESWKGLDMVKESNTLCVAVFMKPITKYSESEPIDKG